MTSNNAFVVSAAVVISFIIGLYVSQVPLAVAQNTGTNQASGWQMIPAGAGNVAWLVNGASGESYICVPSQQGSPHCLKAIREK